MFQLGMFSKTNHLDNLIKNNKNLTAEEILDLPEILQEMKFNDKLSKILVKNSEILTRFIDYALFPQNIHAQMPQRKLVKFAYISSQYFANQPDYIADFLLGDDVRYLFQNSRKSTIDQAKFITSKPDVIVDEQDKMHLEQEHMEIINNDEILNNIDDFSQNKNDMEFDDKIIDFKIQPQQGLQIMRKIMSFLQNLQQNVQNQNQNNINELIDKETQIGYFDNILSMISHESLWEFLYNENIKEKDSIDYINLYLENLNYQKISQIIIKLLLSKDEEESNNKNQNSINLDGYQIQPDCVQDKNGDNIVDQNNTSIQSDIKQEKDQQQNLLLKQINKYKLQTFQKICEQFFQIYNNQNDQDLDQNQQIFQQDKIENILQIFQFILQTDEENQNKNQNNSFGELKQLERINSTDSNQSVQQPQFNLENKNHKIFIQILANKLEQFIQLFFQINNDYNLNLLNVILQIFNQSPQILEQNLFKQIWILFNNYKENFINIMKNNTITNNQQGYILNQIQQKQQIFGITKINILNIFSQLFQKYDDIQRTWFIKQIKSEEQKDIKQIFHNSILQIIQEYQFHIWLFKIPLQYPLYDLLHQQIIQLLIQIIDTQDEQILQIFLPQIQEALIEHFRESMNQNNINQTLLSTQQQKYNWKIPNSFYMKLSQIIHEKCEIQASLIIKTIFNSQNSIWKRICIQVQAINQLENNYKLGTTCQSPLKKETISNLELNKYNSSPPKLQQQQIDKEEKEKEIKNKFALLVTLLTQGGGQGCPKEECKNPYCKNNPDVKEYTKEQAAAQGIFFIRNHKIQQVKTCQEYEDLNKHQLGQSKDKWQCQVCKMCNLYQNNVCSRCDSEKGEINQHSINFKQQPSKNDQIQEEDKDQIENQDNIIITDNYKDNIFQNLTENDKIEEINAEEAEINQQNDNNMQEENLNKEISNEKDKITNELQQTENENENKDIQQNNNKNSLQD